MKWCTHCGLPHDRSHHWCADCYATWQRQYRLLNDDSVEQQAKKICRDAARAARRSGILVPKPCEVCGSQRVEMHHADYTKPLEVAWLCVEHHQDSTRRETFVARLRAERAASIRAIHQRAA